ncbi:MAG: hypothetical protein KGJ51_07415 [Acidobacteriota bacterium]|nr:hypothetical protein [Acidobacteriota bacterium]
MRKVYAALNATLNQRHSPGQKLDYLLPGPDLPYIDLDKRTYAKLHIDEAAAEDELAALLPGAVSAQAPKPDTALPADHRLPVTPRLRDVYTRLQLASGPLPPSDWGRLLAHSYTDHGNWYVMAILDPYQLAGASAFAGTNHFTPWSYDRHVPLAFFGQPFIPGEYHGRVAPVDLAVTLASLAGTNLPSAAVGHVLTQAIQPTHPAGH